MSRLLLFALVVAVAMVNQRCCCHMRRMTTRTVDIPMLTSVTQLSASAAARSSIPPPPSTPAVAGHWSGSASKLTALSPSPPPLSSPSGTATAKAATAQSPNEVIKQMPSMTWKRFVSQLKLLARSNPTLTQADKSFLLSEIDLRQNQMDFLALGESLKCLGTLKFDRKDARVQALVTDVFDALERTIVPQPNSRVAPSSSSSLSSSTSSPLSSPSTIVGGGRGGGGGATDRAVATVLGGLFRIGTRAWKELSPKQRDLLLDRIEATVFLAAERQSAHSLSRGLGYLPDVVWTLGKMGLDINDKAIARRPEFKGRLMRAVAAAAGAVGMRSGRREGTRTGNGKDGLGDDLGLDGEDIDEDEDGPYSSASASNTAVELSRLLYGLSQMKVLWGRDVGGEAQRALAGALTAVLAEGGASGGADWGPGQGQGRGQYLGRGYVNGTALDTGAMAVVGGGGMNEMTLVNVVYALGKMESRWAGRGDRNSGISDKGSDRGRGGGGDGGGVSLGLNPEARRQLLEELLRVVPSMGPAALANTLWGLGKMGVKWGYLPLALRDGLSNRIIQVSPLGSRAVTTTFTGLSKMGAVWPNAPVLSLAPLSSSELSRRLCRALLESLPPPSAASEQTVSNVLHALGTMGATWPSLDRLEDEDEDEDEGEEDRVLDLEGDGGEGRGARLEGERVHWEVGDVEAEGDEGSRGMGAGSEWADVEGELIGERMRGGRSGAGSSPQQPPWRPSSARAGGRGTPVMGRGRGRGTPVMGRGRGRGADRHRYQALLLASVAFAAPTFTDQGLTSALHGLARLGCRFPQHLTSQAARALEAALFDQGTKEQADEGLAGQGGGRVRGGREGGREGGRLARLGDQSVANLVWSLGVCGVRWVAPHPLPLAPSAGMGVGVPVPRTRAGFIPYRGCGWHKTLAGEGEGEGDATAADDAGVADEGQEEEGGEARRQGDRYEGLGAALDAVFSGLLDKATDGTPQTSAQQQQDWVLQEREQERQLWAADCCSELSQALERSASALSEQGLANSLLGLAKMGALWSDRPSPSATQLPSSSSSSSSSSVPLLPSSTRLALCRALRRVVPSLTQQGLSNTLWALAVMQAPLTLSADPLARGPSAPFKAASGDDDEDEEALLLEEVRKGLVTAALRLAGHRLDGEGSATDDTSGADVDEADGRTRPPWAGAAGTGSGPRSGAVRIGADGGLSAQTVAGLLYALSLSLSPDGAAFASSHPSPAADATSAPTSTESLPQRASPSPSPSVSDCGYTAIHPSVRGLLEEAIARLFAPDHHSHSDRSCGSLGHSPSPASAKDVGLTLYAMGRLNASLAGLPLLTRRALLASVVTICSDSLRSRAAGGMPPGVLGSGALDEQQLGQVVWGLGRMGHALPLRGESRFRDLLFATVVRAEGGEGVAFGSYSGKGDGLIRCVDGSRGRDGPAAGSLLTRRSLVAVLQGLCLSIGSGASAAAAAVSGESSPLASPPAASAQALGLPPAWALLPPPLTVALCRAILRVTAAPSPPASPSFPVASPSTAVWSVAASKTLLPDLRLASTVLYWLGRLQAGWPRQPSVRLIDGSSEDLGRPPVEAPSERNPASLPGAVADRLLAVIEEDLDRLGAGQRGDGHGGPKDGSRLSSSSLVLALNGLARMGANWPQLRDSHRAALLRTLEAALSHSRTLSPAEVASALWSLGRMQVPLAELLRVPVVRGGGGESDGTRTVSAVPPDTVVVSTLKPDSRDEERTSAVGMIEGALADSNVSPVADMYATSSKGLVDSDAPPDQRRGGHGLSLGQLLLEALEARLGVEQEQGTTPIRRQEPQGYPDDDAWQHTEQSLDSAGGGREQGMDKSMAMGMGMGMGMGAYELAWSLWALGRMGARYTDLAAGGLTRALPSTLLGAAETHIQNQSMQERELGIVLWAVGKLQYPVNDLPLSMRQSFVRGLEEMVLFALEQKEKERVRGGGVGGGGRGRMEDGREPLEGAVTGYRHRRGRE